MLPKRSPRHVRWWKIIRAILHLTGILATLDILTPVAPVTLDPRLRVDDHSVYMQDLRPSRSGPRGWPRRAHVGVHRHEPDTATGIDHGAGGKAWVDPPDVSIGHQLRQRGRALVSNPRACERLWLRKYGRTGIRRVSQGIGCHGGRVRPGGRAARPVVRWTLRHISCSPRGGRGDGHARKRGYEDEDTNPSRSQGQHSTQLLLPPSIYSPNAVVAVICSVKAVAYDESLAGFRVQRNLVLPGMPRPIVPRP